MSKYVSTSIRSSFIVQEQAFNFLCCRTSANSYWSHGHSLPDVCSRGAISQHLKAQHLGTFRFPDCRLTILIVTSACDEQ